MVFRIASSPIPITSGRPRVLCCWCCSPLCLALWSRHSFRLGHRTADCPRRPDGWATEAAILKLRKQPVAATLKDNSALLTGLLLAVSIPPLAPWWMVVLGTAFAVVIAKQLYGGTGHNPFNPAMIGYVVLLISFPVQMTSGCLPMR